MWLNIRNEMMKYTKKYMIENNIRIITIKDEFQYVAVSKKIIDLGFETRGDLIKGYNDFKEKTIITNIGNYWTNMPNHSRINNGITAEEFLKDMDKKKCNKCEAYKETSEFHKDDNCKDNFKTICKKCTSKDRKERREDSITLTGDDKRRWEIQKKIEGWCKNTIKKDFFDISKDIKRCFDNGLSYYGLKSIVGESDLKWFFGIAETMTMKEAIEKNLDFEFEGTKYIFIESGELVKCCAVPDIDIKWVLKNQNETVTIRGNK
jgi:hypothetical protein